MIEFIQVMIHGIVLGGIISLGAIGVSLLFGTLGFAHFAHGDMMTLGAYTALAFVTGLGVSVWVAFPFAVVIGMLAAVGIDQLVYRRLRHTKPIILLIASVGVALILRSLVQLIWGTDTQVFQQGIQFPLKFGYFHIKPNQLYVLLGAIGLVILLHLFLNRTKLGKAMRAMADDPDLARVTGIDTDRVILWTWCIGAGLAVAAGIFLGIDTRLHPTMGWHLLLPVFAGAILGGIGKPYGAIAGGMTVGIATELSTLFIQPSYKPAIAFALMVLMLILRPKGLFGGR